MCRTLPTTNERGAVDSSFPASFAGQMMKIRILWMRQVDQARSHWQALKTRVNLQVYLFLIVHLWRWDLRTRSQHWNELARVTLRDRLSIRFWFISSSPPRADQEHAEEVLYASWPLKDLAAPMKSWRSWPWTRTVAVSYPGPEWRKMDGRWTQACCWFVARSCKS